jgi:hypothetical protein
MNLVHLVNPVSPVKGFCLGSVLRRIFLRFLHTLITTNCNLFSSHGDFDSAIIDRPITDRTFARVHDLSPLLK